MATPKNCVTKNIFFLHPRWAQSRVAKQAGILTQQDTQMTSTDLEKLKVQAGVSQTRLQNTVRFMKNNMGIRFGQTITNLIARKKGRRHNIHYTKAEVRQEDQSTPAFYFRRADDLCDIVADRVGQLKTNGGFKEVDMRRGESARPAGQVDHYISPVFDNGGKEMKYILQCRNTGKPQHTSAATLFGSVMKAGLHQKGKVDNRENIFALLTQRGPGQKLSLVQQLKELEESSIVSFTARFTPNKATKHFCCLPGDISVAPFIVSGGATSDSELGEVDLRVPSKSLSGDESGSAIERLRGVVGHWIPIEASGSVGHLVKLRKATTWRDLASWSEMFTDEKTSRLYAAKHGCLNNPQCYRGITDFLCAAGQVAMMNSCKAFKVSRECDIMERGHAKHSYSIYLHTSDVKTIYPPLPVPPCDSVDLLSKRLRPCALEWKIDGPVVCVEASDMMGLNLHRGMQGSGNMKCMCYCCNAQTLHKLNEGECAGGEPRTWENCRGWSQMYVANSKCDAVERANTHKPPIYICPHTAPVPLHIVLGTVNTLREWIGSVCRKADKLTPRGEGENTERKIHCLKEQLEDAEAELAAVREQSKQTKTQLTKAGFDAADLIQMGRAAQHMTDPTLIGAVVEMSISGQNYRGEVVKHDADDATENTPWLVHFDDGDKEHTTRRKLAIIKHSLMGRKIKKDFSGIAYPGEVADYDNFGATRGTPWLVVFEDGDREHMSRAEVERYSAPGDDNGVGMRGCDAAKKLG